MQTFLPYKNFDETAQVLDSRRLNKQILECYQILKVLSSDDPKAAWRNHPAVKMWRGHEGHFWVYVMAMVKEANKRGIKTINNVANLNALKLAKGSLWGYSMPLWIKNPFVMAKVLATHKANLYRKDSIHYFQFYSELSNPDNSPCCDKCQYYWVTHVA